MNDQPYDFGLCPLEVEEYAAAGMTVSEAAKLLNAQTRVVRAAANALGVKFRDNRRRRA